MLNKPEGVGQHIHRQAGYHGGGSLGTPTPAGAVPGGSAEASTGFVLLTDDGGFAHDILAPKRHVSKTYGGDRHTADRQKMVERLCRGRDAGGRHRPPPAAVEPVSADYTVRCCSKQGGVYHQIKRMFGVYGAGGEQAAPGRHRRPCLDPALAPGQWRSYASGKYTG